jgi:hypothetical protein
MDPAKPNALIQQKNTNNGLHLLDLHHKLSWSVVAINDTTLLFSHSCGLSPFRQSGLKKLMDIQTSSLILFLNLKTMLLSFLFLLGKGL